MRARPFDLTPGKFLVRPAGIEPATCGFEERLSSEFLTPCPGAWFPAFITNVTGLDASMSCSQFYSF